MLSIERGRRLSGLALFHFALVLGALLPSPAFALQTRTEAKRSLGLGLEIGVDCVRETGIAWGVETRLGTVASYGSTFLDLRLSSLAGEIDPDSGLSLRGLDSAMLGLGCRLAERPRFCLIPEAFWRWRSYGSSGFENCYGLVLNMEAGRGRVSRGSAFLASCGYAVLRSSYEYSSEKSRDIYPLLRLGYRYRPGPRLAFDLAISDFTDSDSATFLKTFLEFHTLLALRSATVDLKLCAKYSDFFTLTAYIDGFSVGFDLRWPLIPSRNGG